MKKIFYILIIFFVSCKTMGQTFLPPRSSATTTVQDSRWRALLTAYMPHTRGLTLNGGLDTLGAFIYDDSSRHVWFRDSSGSGGHLWSKLLKTGDAGDGTVTQINTGFWMVPITITTVGTINADSAAMAAYFPRRKDSTISFVTPTQMNAQGFIKTISGITAGGDLTGTYANPSIANNAVSFSKFQQLPGFTFVGNPTASAGNAQASYFGYGLRWNNDSVKVDTSLLKSVFGSMGVSGITQLTGDGLAGPGNGSQVFTLATVNGNVFVSNTFLKFSVNAKGLVTGAAAVGSGDIAGALGFTPIQLSSLSGAPPIVYNSSTGLISMANSGVAAGSYTNSNVTVNALGIITSINSGSGGTGGTNSNAGTGFRWAIPNSNNIKTIFCVGCTLDSTTNSNALTITVTGGGGTDSGIIARNGILASRLSGGPSVLLQVDSSMYATLSRVQKPIDSLGILISGKQPTGTYLTGGGNLAPLFTTSVTGTTLNFTFGVASANSAFGNFTGSPGTPNFGKLPLAALGNSSANSIIGFDGSGNPINVTAGTNIIINTGTISATASANSNLGSGFRFAVPNTNGIKTLFCAGCSIDSTSNANALTITVTAGGSGTVTVFSAGTLSPLFTTSVATATTTPALTFSLSTAAANSVFGNNTGSVAAPGYFVPTAATLNGWFGGTIQAGLSNVGSGFRLFSPQTGIKTLFCVGCTIDSTTNANGLTFTVAGGGSDSGIIAGTEILVSRLGPSTRVVSVDTSSAGVPTQKALRDTTHMDGHMYSTAYSPSGKKLVFIGHSYVFGANASVPAKRYTSLVTTAVNGIEVNLGQSGRTMMLQQPKDYQGAQSMNEIWASIPMYDYTYDFLLVDIGLNDAGQTAAAYTTTNYLAAADSFFNQVIVTKGWPRNKVGILGLEWIGQTALTYYGSITSNPAPTVARMISFDSCNYVEANKWRIKWIPTYNQILTHDSTLLGGTGSVHPTDSGYLYMSQIVLQKLGLVPGSPFVQSGTLITPIIINSNLRMGSQTGVSTASPNYLSLGGQFANTTGNPANCKLKFYDDGTANNNFGFSISSGHFEYHGGGTGTSHDFYINGAGPFFTITNNGLFIRNAVSVNSLTFGTHTSSGTTTPTYIDLGATFNSNSVDSVHLKVFLYTTGTSSAGLNFSGSGFDLYSPHGFPYIFHYDATPALTVSKTLTLGNYGTGSITGTATFNLAVTSTGQVIEVSTAGGSQNLEQVLTVGGTITNPHTITTTGQILTFAEGGTGTIKFTGMYADTTTALGLYSYGSDSSLRRINWAQVAAKLPAFNLFAANGLSSSTVIADSIYWGGTLNQNTIINASASNFNVTLGGTNFLGTFTTNFNTSSTFNTGSGGNVIFTGNGVRASQILSGDANVTLGAGVNSMIILLQGITANRTVTLSSPATGQTYEFDNANTSTSNNWTFATTVQNPGGVTITSIPQGRTKIYYNGSAWILVSQSNTSGWVDQVGITSGGVTLGGAAATSYTATYRIDAYLTVNSISGDQIQLLASYTDETNTARTVNMIPVGGTASILTGTGLYSYSYTVRVKAGSGLGTQTNLVVGAGSINYDAGSVVTLLSY